MRIGGLADHEDRRSPPTNSDAATNVAAIKVATTNDQMIRAGISWIPQYE